MKPVSEQLDLIQRGIVEIVPEEELVPKLENAIKTNTPLRIKLGVDPTAPDIHLGFTVVMRKIRQFQDLGHTAVLIIGDYTATIGDPSGKNQARPMVSHEEVLANAETYKEQFFRIVDRDRCEVVLNGDWFRKMDFAGIIKLTSQITVAQMLEREDFKKRYTSGQAISLHEFMYPLMQGYDSVEIKSDIEIGGTDQKFNVLVGRDLQKEWSMAPQLGLFMPLLLGTDGQEKMSKSLGNYIGIAETAQSMYHKLINIPDDIVANYYELLTDTPMAQIEKNKEDLVSGKLDARLWKADLARIIVTEYHGQDKAQKAEAEEKKIHAGETIPQDTPVFKIKEASLNVLDLLCQCKFFASKGEAKRMILNGGVSIDQKKITDPKSNVEIQGELVIRVGKRRFAKAKLA